jgi:hypothetical protein
MTTGACLSVRGTGRWGGGGGGPARSRAARRQSELHVRGGVELTFADWARMVGKLNLKFDLNLTKALEIDLGKF